MTKQEATKEAKAAGLYFAIEGLTNRLEGDIVDEIEICSYKMEIERLSVQLKKLGLS